MSEERAEKTVSARRSPLVIAMVVAVILIVGFLLVLQLPLFRPPTPPRVFRVLCLANLRGMGLEMHAYADEHGEFPPADQWCSVLEEYYRKRTGEVDGEFRGFCCPKASRDMWGYAMNPLAKAGSGSDVVLVFESAGGWNQSGGLELLTTERHEGCCVLFVNGSVMFIKPEEVAGLKWVDERMSPPDVPSAGARRDDSELKY